MKCNPHALRRTFATISTKNGMPPFILQRILGHSTITTTLFYVGLVDDDLMAGHKQWGPFSNGLHKKINGSDDSPGGFAL